MDYNCVSINRKINDKFSLMELFSSCLLLGRSKFDNWDQFEELMISKLERSEDFLYISGVENVNLDDKSQMIFLKILDNLSSDFPMRIITK